MRAILAFAIAASLGTAIAQPTTFRISQVYSNLDGSVQFVELTESAGLNGQHRIGGLTLTSTQHGITNQFVIPRDLPTDRTAYLSIVVATDRLRAQGVDGGWPVQDVDVPGMPVLFLGTEHGTLDFAGVDRLSYASLPTDGQTSLHADGGVRAASVPSRDDCVAPPCKRCTTREDYAHAIEYYHVELDHYFISASAADIYALDNGLLKGWSRTGRVLAVNSTPLPDLDRPVCRFYIPPADGDSHWYSAASDECDAVRRQYPSYRRERGAAFYGALPDRITGTCHAESTPWWYLAPVYRLWNGRRDSNHRYTSDPAIRDEMRRRGYVSEGYGPDGVAMCLYTSPGDPPAAR